MCILQVPCLCDITAKYIHYPPRLGHCQTTNQQPTIAHPINLAVLVHLKETHSLRAFSGETKFPALPNIDMPDIKLFDHKFSKIVASDQQYSLNLKKLIEATKKDKIAYKSLADPIIAHVVTESSLFSVAGIMALISVILTTIWWVIVIIFVGKYRSRLVAILAATPKSSAREIIPDFNLFTSTSAPVTEVQVNCESSQLWLIAYILTTILALVYLVKRVKGNTHGNFHLEISAGKKCVTVPLFSAPVCPKFFRFRTSQPFTNFKVTGFLAPSFSWSYGNLQVDHLGSVTPIKIPNEIPINPISALKLRYILRKDFYEFLMCSHNHLGYYVKLCPIHCQECSPMIQVLEPTITYSTLRANLQDMAVQTNEM